jgi:hypothetical protein
VYIFMKEKYLHWLEALSLCKSIPKGVMSIMVLHNLMLVGPALCGFSTS